MLAANNIASPHTASAAIIVFMVGAPDISCVTIFNLRETGISGRWRVAMDTSIESIQDVLEETAGLDFGPKRRRSLETNCGSQRTRPWGS